MRSGVRLASTKVGDRSLIALPHLMAWTTPAQRCILGQRQPGRATMSITCIGLDLAKSVFQVHGIDINGGAVIRRRLARSQLLPFFARLQPALIGMEACSSAHHWARELMRLGHEVRLIPPQYVKPYVKRTRRTPPTRRPYARRLGGPTCASFQSRHPISRRC